MDIDNDYKIGEIYTFDLNIGGSYRKITGVISEISSIKITVETFFGERIRISLPIQGTERTLSEAEIENWKRKAKDAKGRY